MSDSVLTPGVLVESRHHRGIVVDVRATASGAFVVGIEDPDGEVRYFMQKSLRPAEKA